MEWLAGYWEALTWTKICFGVGFFLASVIFSALVVGVIIVKIPENYFSSHYQEDFLPNTPWFVRWGAVIAKNLVGLILVIAPEYVTVPSVPARLDLTFLSTSQAAFAPDIWVSRKP